jgi:hypothetical protein
LAKAIKFQLKIEYLWGLVALVGIFVFVNTHPIRPHDFWWHITIGREILTTGNIPSVDIYSYTEAGQPYPSYQMFWLMEIILYGIYHLDGPALVIFIFSLLITAAYGVIFWLCHQTSGSWRIGALGVLFAAALGLNDWNVRPQGITFLLASLFLLAIYQYQKQRRWGWLLILPIGMIIWVNSHGTFIIGLALVGIWFGQEIWETIKSPRKSTGTISLKGLSVPAIALLITILACLVNPRGLGIIGYIRTLTGNSAVQNLVTEWAPPTFNTLIGVIFYIGLLGSASVFAVSPKRPNFIQLVTFLIFGILGLRTSRGSVWFGLVMAPALVEHISFILNDLPKKDQQTAKAAGSIYLNLIFTVVVLLMGVISLPWFKGTLPLPQAKAGLISAETPIQATQVLLELKLPGKIFNAESFGSYLIWAAYPQYQVFVDSRIELFSEKVWLDYLNISNANGNWDKSLNEYGVNTLMLSPTEQLGLIEAAKQASGWDQVYQDPAAVIFVRR